MKISRKQNKRADFRRIGARKRKKGPFIFVCVRFPRKKKSLRQEHHGRRDHPADQSNVLHVRTAAGHGAGEPSPEGDTRQEVFNATVLGSGLYGCDTWTCTQAQLNRLEGMHFRLLRRVISGAKRDTPKEGLIKMAAARGTIVQPIAMQIEQRILTKLDYYNIL